MMAGPKRSAGILLARVVDDVVEFLLVHPGGPFWAKKDAGVWSIPKGEYGEGEDPRAAAIREFREELGVDCPAADLIDLGDVIQAGGKRVTAWCAVGSIDVAAIESDLFEIEWPPRSGRMQQFPEVDRAGFFTIAQASEKILGGQRPLLDRAVRVLVESDRIPNPDQG